MGYNKEKEAFLREMFLSLQNQEDQTILSKKLRDLLMTDTVSGKLYKFRSFDSKGHSIQILQDGTLYCSKASAFNDPFDCRVGIDYQSMTSDLCEVELRGVEDLLEKFMQILVGEARLEDFNIDDQGVLSQWVENTKMHEMIAYLQAHPNMTEDDKRQYIAAHYIEIIGFLTPALRSERARNRLKLTGPTISELHKKLLFDGTINTLFDSHSIAEYARAQGIQDDLDEIGLVGLLSKKLDPASVEPVERTEKTINNMNNELSARLDRLYYVGSLCTNNKNRLMWSHYADSHRGFCIEYDFGSEMTLLPFPVVYSRRRPKMSWKAAFDNTPDNQKAASIPFLEAILTKDDAWDYENEWRLIISAEMDPIVKMPPITCIYLGVNCSEDNRRRIFEIADEKGIPVKQMMVDRGEYSLHVM